VRSAAVDTNDPHRVVVELTDAKDKDYVVVTLNDVYGSEGGYSETVSQEMGLLVGDLTGVNGAVNASDLTVIRSHSGSLVSAANFRADVNLSGVINSADVSVVRSNSGNSLPLYP